ncbi:hypothetical protein PHET_02697 [Paragonimus heterotremus]|uniref:Uncharacterized protein n=1 Tax=Paragonimus heterotremus TaxID=100268 RepID=A0A8J4SRL4_9TREM|nr:hypothetical protein PHET_02697 [Paragonimus heterotremus]
MESHDVADTNAPDLTEHPRYGTEASTLPARNSLLEKRLELASMKLRIRKLEKRIKRIEADHHIKHQHLNRSRLEARQLICLARQIRVCDTVLTHLKYYSDLNANRIIETIVRRRPSHNRFKRAEVAGTMTRQYGEL